MDSRVLGLAIALTAPPLALGGCGGGDEQTPEGARDRGPPRLLHRRRPSRPPEWSLAPSR
ncbi:MAG: hypothetical protein M3375_08770 [Actinomycetota bacterium]|nr:hypothetical protein [Actinomycetota bacterium]